MNINKYCRTLRKHRSKMEFCDTIL